MNSSQIALKLLADSVNIENGIGEVSVIEGKNNIHISKVIGSIEYLKSFISDSKQQEYYTISQEVKDQIKIIIESSVQKTGYEYYKYTIIWTTKERKDGLCLLQIDGLHQDFIKLLEKLEINYRYRTDEDLYVKDNKSSELIGTMIAIYCIHKKYTKEKIHKLIDKVLIECMNNNIDQITDIDKQENTIVDIIKKVDIE
jgi:hypothetical protein